MAKSRILIVEDEYIVAMDIRNILEQKLGYSVLGMIRTGEEAIEAARNLNPDLILMDIVLDGQLTGIEAAAIIKQKYDIPVIYLTAFSDKNTLAQAKLTEPYGYLLKPLDEHALHSAIEMGLYKYRSERAILENEERYRMLVENSPVSIAVHCEGKLVYANPAGVRLFGAGKVKELIGCPIMDFIHQDYKQAVQERIDKITTKGMSVEGIPEKLIRLDGKVLDVEISALPTYFGDKPAIEIVIRDVTELMRKDRIQKSVLQLLHYFNLNTTAGEFFQLFSATVKEFIPVDSVFFASCNIHSGEVKYLFSEENDNTDDITLLVEYTIEKNRTVFLNKKAIDAIIPADQEFRPVNWIAVPIQYDEDTTGIIGGLVKSTKESFGHTEENLFELFSFSVSKAVINLIKEEEQDRALSYLENLNSAKDKFFSSLSHELKNNFNALLGYTEILKHSFDSLSQSEIQSSIDSLYSSSRTIYNVIEKLLRFSKFSSQSYKPRLKIISLPEILEKELAGIRNFAEKKNILLRKCIEEDVQIYSDEEILTSILQDFLMQSVRYSKTGSHIEVNAREIKSGVELAITDNGTGIEEYMLKNLFIVKESEDEKAKGYGTGIGFLLTREIIRKCGGELTIENSQGEGSSFRIFLPAAKIQKILT